LKYHFSPAILYPPLEIAASKVQGLRLCPTAPELQSHNTIIQAQLTCKYCCVFIKTICRNSTAAPPTCSRVKNLQPRTGKPETFSLHTPNACESDPGPPVLESASHQ
jgi:hypothetical protein